MSTNEKENQPLPLLVVERAAVAPGAAAILKWHSASGNSRAICYQQLRDGMLSSVAWLVDVVKPTEREYLPIYAENSVEYLLIALGAWCLGAVSVHLNTRQVRDRPWPHQWRITNALSYAVPRPHRHPPRPLRCWTCCKPGSSSARPTRPPRRGRQSGPLSGRHPLRSPSHRRQISSSARWVTCAPVYLPNALLPFSSLAERLANQRRCRTPTRASCSLLAGSSLLALFPSKGPRRAHCHLCLSTMSWALLRRCSSTSSLDVARTSWRTLTSCPNKMSLLPPFVSVRGSVGVYVCARAAPLSHPQSTNPAGKAIEICAFSSSQRAHSSDGMYVY